jgi:hypothetical protein
MAEQSKTNRWRRRHKQLLQERQSQNWESHWNEIVEYCLPRRGRYLNSQNDSTQNNDGSKKHSKIFNSTAVTSLGILAAGLRSGRTSPSSPWFSLGLVDEDLAEFAPVREWLHNVRNILMQILSRSNFYRSMHYLYTEIGGFGTNAMMIEEDLTSVIRCRPFTIGEYCLTLDSLYRPESLYRQFSMTACQMQEMFGKGDDKTQGLPIEVKTALDNGNVDKPFEVVHVIEKNGYIKSDKADHRGMAFKSVYYPLGGDENLILREGGYREIPFIAPRWSVAGIDTYGSSPAMDVLADTKMLQKEESQKLKALDKQVDPPMTGPMSLKNSDATIVSGGVTWVDVQQGQQGFQPAYQVNPRIQDLRVDIDIVERRIRDGFYNNLFLAVLNEDKKMTAYEVAKRYEEKASVLGPVFDGLDEEANDPIVDRVFAIANNLGLLPPPPPDLPQGMPLKVEYVSLLSKAQKAVETASIDQLVNFTLLTMQANPDAIDKVDVDEAMDQYGDGLGVAPKIIRSDDNVKLLREEKKKMQQAQQMIANAESTANAVKAAGETPMQGGETTALDMMTGNA